MLEAWEALPPAHMRLMPCSSSQPDVASLKFRHEGAARDLTVGEDLAAEVPLLVEEAPDVLLLERPKVASGRTGGACIEDLPRAQKAANVVGAILEAHHDLPRTWCASVLSRYRAEALPVVLVAVLICLVRTLFGNADVAGLLRRQLR